MINHITPGQVLILLSALYLIMGLFIHLGLIRNISSSNKLPQVSILIAVRDEEENIAQCLESVIGINYPKDSLEVIVIDDQSRDGTAAIVSRFERKYSFIKLLCVTGNSEGLKGKMNALHQGIKFASGDLLLVTDADCRVPSDWVKGYVTQFDDGVGIAGGLTLLSRKGDRESWFQKIQALDWVFLQTVASGTAEMGLPVTILGNNMAFTRQAYEAVGGFPAIGFSITEDMALMRAIAKQTNQKVRYQLRPETTIYSQAAPDWRSFYRQRKRWILGGKHTSLWGYFLIGLGVAAHLFLIVSLFWGISFNTWFIAFAIPFFTNLSLTGRILHRIRRLDLLKYFLHFEVFYFLYLIVFALITPFIRKVEWKGRVYSE